MHTILLQQLYLLNNFVLNEINNRICKRKLHNWEKILPNPDLLKFQDKD